MHVIEDFDFRGDETAYLFVLFNLIKNALYYLALDPGARITITVAEHQVKVRDTGPGIAPDVLASCSSRSRSVGKSGGTGLGLAYCRRVMRAFGGEIELRIGAGRIHRSSPCVSRRSAQESASSIAWRSWPARAPPSPASGC